MKQTNKVHPKNKKRAENLKTKERVGTKQKITKLAKVISKCSIGNVEKRRKNRRSRINVNG
jgi:hypothetical protein